MIRRRFATRLLLVLLAVGNAGGVRSAVLGDVVPAVSAEEELYRARVEQSCRRSYWWYRDSVSPYVRSGHAGMVVTLTRDFVTTPHAPFVWRAIRVQRTDTKGATTPVLDWPEGGKRFSWPKLRYTKFGATHVTWYTNRQRHWLLVETSRTENGRFLNDVGIKLALEPTDATVTGWSQKRPTFRETLRDWPAPDLAQLRQRCAPNVKWPESSDSFSDILKLRDCGDERAVPMLQDVLAENFTNGRIHGFAAAQALFCIGSPEANRALACQPWTNWFQVDWAINYTTHWEMPEPQRSRFIQQYFLRSISTNLVLEVQDISSARKSRDLREFELKFRNTSQAPFALLLPEIAPDMLLYIRDAQGRILPRILHPPDSAMYPPRCVKLEPGGSHDLRARLFLEVAETIRDRGELGAGKVLVVVDGAAVRFDIETLTGLEIVAMFEQPPLNQATRSYHKILDGQEAWSGRVVSAPAKASFALQETASPAASPDQ